jgi:flagella synthesis protein FlgN
VGLHRPFDSADGAAAALIDALRVETAGYRALITVLEAERSALCAADADALATLSGVKLERVSALHGLARARGALLEKNASLDIASALAAFAGSPDGDALRREWSALIELAASARALNEVNGRLIAQQRRHFDVALQSLLQAAGVQPVYGADGRPQRVAPTRTFAAA